MPCLFCQGPLDGPHDRELHGRWFVLPPQDASVLVEYLLQPDEERFNLPRKARPPRQQVKLTSRELEILALVHRRMHNQDIAQALGISEQTVKNHITNVMAKTGTRNRHLAVEFAIRRHFLQSALTGAERTRAWRARKRKTRSTTAAGGGTTDSGTFAYTSSEARAE